MFEHGLARGDARHVRGEVRPVVRAEEEDAVLEEKSPEIHAVVAALIVGQPHPAQRRVPRFIVNARGPRAGAVVVEERSSMEGVAPRLRDDVDDSSERPSVLGLEAAGPDLDRLDGLVVEPLALNAFHHVGRRYAVDRPLALGGGRAVHGDGDRASLRCAMIGHDAGMGVRDVRVVAIHGEVDDHVAVIGSRRRGGRGVHEGRLARDQDLLAKRELQDQRNRRDLVRADCHGLLDARESGPTDPHDVPAGRQRRQPVRSVLGRDRRSVRGRARASRLNGDARERRAE